MKLFLSTLAALALSACTGRDPHSSAPSLGRELAPGANEQEPQPVTKPSADRTSSALARSVTYRDGDSERRLWLSDELVAEITPTDASRSELLRSDPAAEEVPQSQSTVRVWRVRAVQGTDVFAANLTRDAQRFSPVLHQTSSPSSSIVALPGGVVATFQPGWDRARIDTWLATRNLKVEGEIGGGMNMFLISTPPGLASLAISDQLAQTGALVGCEPNFWLPAATR